MDHLEPQHPAGAWVFLPTMCWIPV